MFGASARAGDMIDPVPDAVFLMAHDSASLLGLTDIRVQTWLEGRPGPLRLVGGDTLPDMLARLDEAYAGSDAVHVMAARGELAFSGAAFLPVSVDLGARNVSVFETGDVSVHAFSMTSATGDEVIAYHVRHENQSAVVFSCAADPRVIVASIQDLAPVDWVIAPVANEEALFAERRMALDARDRARARRWADVLATCPTPAQLADTASRLGARGLVLLSPVQRRADEALLADIEMLKEPAASDIAILTSRDADGPNDNGA